MYDGKWEGNILIIGRTWCRKTTFVQNLAKNKLFGDKKRYIGYLKLNFLKTERKMLETVLQIKL